MLSSKLSSHTAHSDVWMLLPWYVNGTLEGTELNKVQQHLRVCITCRQELAEQQKLAEAIGQSSVIDLAPQASLARLLQRIDSEVPPADRRQKGWSRLRSLWTQLLEWLSGLRLPQRAWIAVSLLVILLVLAPTARFWLSSVPREPQYHTLASPNSVPAAGSTDIQVVFAKTLDQEQIQQVLHSLPAEIVAGPSASGTYTVRIITRDRSNQEMLAMLVRLSQQPGVLRVEPADASVLPKTGAGSAP
jgi:hypothetical protein